MLELRGRLQAYDARIGIVVSDFNELITKSLLEGALDGLKKCGVPENEVIVAHVPGAFEIPTAANSMAKSEKYDAIICLGAIIRGATSHFDYVCSSVASGIAKISVETGIPVIFGVLTTETIEQAIERAGTKAGNKGKEAALAAVEMIDLLRQLNKTAEKEAACKL